MRNVNYDRADRAFGFREGVSVGDLVQGVALGNNRLQCAFSRLRKYTTVLR
jgi:hypothetical protein